MIRIRQIGSICFLDFLSDHLQLFVVSSDLFGKFLIPFTGLRKAQRKEKAQLSFRGRMQLIGFPEKIRAAKACRTVNL